MRNSVGVPLLCLALIACSEKEATPVRSVNDLMVDVVAPQSEILWSVEDPATAEDWQELGVAASAIVSAGQQLQQGGTGPQDMEWAADPAWQMYVTELVNAAKAARDAANAANLDAVFAANDELYPPCEECHIKFHPGVAGEDLN